MKTMIPKDKVKKVNREQDILNVTNILDTEFIVKWNGQEIAILEPGETKPFVIYTAENIAKHMARTYVARKRLSRLDLNKTAMRILGLDEGEDGIKIKDLSTEELREYAVSKGIDIKMKNGKIKAKNKIIKELGDFKLGK